MNAPRRVTAVPTAHAARHDAFRAELDAALYVRMFEVFIHGLMAMTDER